jgi:hypothetical protein
MASIYFDRSSKGTGKKAKKTKYHNSWRAEYWEDKKRYRKRFKDLAQAQEWLDSNNQKFKN